MHKVHLGHRAVCVLASTITAIHCRSIFLHRSGCDIPNVSRHKSAPGVCRVAISADGRAPDMGACAQVPRQYHGTKLESTGRVEDVSKPDVAPRSFKLWVKPAVRWVFAAMAAGIVAWTMMQHAAKQKTQQKQEAAHARCFTFHQRRTS